MKKVINVALGLCVLAMLFICWRSIADQQQFDQDVKVREAAVKARLIEIRSAQEAYKAQNPYVGYCASWDTLIAFVKEGKLPIVVKEGILSDEQMEKGLTESKAAAIVARGNAEEIAKNGLQNFRRDTTWVSLRDSLYKNPDFNPDELRYVPGSDVVDGQKKEFDLIAVWIKTKSEAIIPVMECGATYDVYLVGDSKQWKRTVINLTEKSNSQGTYNGLRIGDASLTWNNNAGSWE